MYRSLTSEEHDEQLQRNNINISVSSSVLVMISKNFFITFCFKQTAVENSVFKNTANVVYLFKKINIIELQPHFELFLVRILKVQCLWLQLLQGWKEQAFVFCSADSIFHTVLADVQTTLEGHILKKIWQFLIFNHFWDMN